jgi:hypothetical protein
MKQLNVVFVLEKIGIGSLWCRLVGRQVLHHNLNEEYSQSWKMAGKARESRRTEGEEVGIKRKETMTKKESRERERSIQALWEELVA